MDQNRTLKELSNNINLMENNSLTNSLKSPTVSNNTASDLKVENLENQEIFQDSKENNPKSLCELAAEKTTVLGINNNTSTPKAPISTKNPTFNFAKEENCKPINKKLSLSETPTKSDSLSFLATGLGQLQIEDSVPSENATYLQSQTITSDDEQFLECESFVSANTTRVLETEEPEKTVEVEEKTLEEISNITATVEPQIDHGNLNETVDIENVEIKVETVPDEFPALDMNRTMDVVKISDTFIEEKMDATFNTETAENYDLNNVTTTLESSPANITFDHHEISDDKNESGDKIMSMTLECQLLEEDKPVELAENVAKSPEATVTEPLFDSLDEISNEPEKPNNTEIEVAEEAKEDEVIENVVPESVEVIEEEKEKETVEPTRVKMAEEEMMEVDDYVFDSETPTVKIEKLQDSEFDNKNCAKVNRIFSEGDVFDEFKKPDIPTTKTRRSDPFAGATQFSSFENEEFKSSTGFKFSAADFDLLDQFGAPPSAINDIRNSVLLNFDPLLNKPIVNENNNNNIKNQLKATKLSITKEESVSNNDLELDFEVQTKELSSISNNNPATIEEENYTENSIDIKQELSTESIDSNKLKLNASNELEHDLQHQLDHVKMNVDAMKDFIVDSRESAKLECQDIKTNQEQEYKMADLENKIKNEVLKTEEIENKLKEAEMREEALLKRITEKDKTIAKMSSVVEAYEKAISELIAEKEQLQQNYEKQCAELKHDSEINAQHLASLEVTFSDIHAKYERAKQVANELKEREDFLLQERKTNAENLRMQEIRYDKMKSHAMAQLEIANNTLAEITRNHNAEVTKLKAILRKEEVSKASVMEQLQQKTKENEELVKICDELINGGQTS